jgi:predicted HTH domain antitoxin
LQVLLNQMAVMVSVQLPADLTSEFESEDLSEEVARLLALELFRERKVSLGRAAELCSMPLAAFMKFSADRGVPPMTYSLDDLEADRQTIERLGL